MSAKTETPLTQDERPRRMLAPAAYSEIAMPSLRLARSSRLVRLLGKLLLAFLLMGLALVAIAPWQQSVRGTGNVVAYSPTERQQVLEAPIKGRIVRLGDGLVENARVAKGQLIAEIADIDPKYLERLQSKLRASENQVDAEEALLKANESNQETVETVVDSFKAQIGAYEEVKKQTIAAADAAVESARNKVEAQQQLLNEHKAARVQIKADFDRQETLYRERITSQLKFQETEFKLSEIEAKISKVEAYIKAAENDVNAKLRERDAKEQEAQVKIDYATALYRKAQADISKAESEVAKAQSQLNKAQKELYATQTEVERQRSQSLTAPFDGIVTQITPNQGSRILKQGDPICLIVPDTADRAVQLWLDGNDAPLVEPGRYVRLQFEGWPAMQFAGWPSVAVGTFGGQVVSVDATDDGKGKFRILIRPDDADMAWPRDRFLRQGVRANGWVLLNQVPLWYEIWRNMNGFPPVVSTDEPKSKGKKPPLPKP